MTTMKFIYIMNDNVNCYNILKGNTLINIKIPDMSATLSE